MIVYSVVYSSGRHVYFMYTVQQFISIWFDVASSIILIMTRFLGGVGSIFFVFGILVVSTAGGILSGEPSSEKFALYFFCVSFPVLSFPFSLLDPFQRYGILVDPVFSVRYFSIVCQLFSVIFLL